MAFLEKNFIFWKQLLKIAVFAVESDWISKCSQNVKKLGFLLKKKNGFSEKSLIFFENAKSSKFSAKCDWKSKTSQNVQKIKKWPLLKKKDGYFEKNHDFYENSLKVANLP